jgi:hypothetical protein
MSAPDPAPLSEQPYVGFPPGSGFVQLPRRPHRAARAGIALYEGVLPRQRLAIVVGRGILGARLTGLLPDGRRQEIDWAWWQRLVDEVVTPVTGPIGHAAFRVPANPRHSALLMTRTGRPVAFAKILGVERTGRSRQALQLLDATASTVVRAPAPLASGTLQGVPYEVMEPLPEGAHRPPPFDLQHLRRVIDEFRARLEGLPRPVGTPERHVAVHSDLTPRNLRVAKDGTWWVYDLDRVQFGPALADELRYLCASFAYRRRPRLERDVAEIVRLLRQRGTDEDILEAVEWPGRMARTYLAVEDDMHAAIGDVARRAIAAASPASGAQ